MDQLPRDIMYRIVDRLSVKCLARFRCARKEWYEDPFILSRITKCIEEPKLLLIRPDAKPSFQVDVDGGFVKASIPHLASSPKLLGSCNGLLCLEDVSGVLVLVNPLLEEIMSVSPLPPPNKRGLGTQLRGSLDYGINALTRGCRATGFGLDHVRALYKFVVVSFTYPWVMTKVLDLSTGSWREIRSPEGLPPQGRGVFLGGSLYWRMNCRRSRPALVSFDVAKEEFDLVACPAPVDSCFDLGNQLGVMSFEFTGPKQFMVILEHNTYSKEWNHKYKISVGLLQTQCYGPLYVGNYFYGFLGNWNRVLVFEVGERCDPYTYDPQTCTFERFCYDGLDTIASTSRSYCFRGSLVSVSRCIYPY